MSSSRLRLLFVDSFLVAAPTQLNSVAADVSWLALISVWQRAASDMAARGHTAVVLCPAGDILAAGRC